MQSATYPKEETMKATITTGYARILAIVAVAIPIAAMLGTSFKY